MEFISVTRCKDCIFYDNLCEECNEDEYIIRKVGENDYCSFAGNKEKAEAFKYGDY